MRKTVVWLFIGLVAIAGCQSEENKQGKNERPETGQGKSEPVSSDSASASSWQPDPAKLKELGTEQKVFSGRAALRPPPGFKFEQVEFISTPLATFVKDSSRVEIVLVKDVPESVTAADFAETTRKLHISLPELNQLEVDEIEHGSIGGLPFERIRYRGINDAKEKIAGVSLITRPQSSGPIWNVIAQGKQDVFPLLEAAALTFRIP